MDVEARPFEALEAQLLPDDQRRVFAILFRLPTELPLHNRDSWTLHFPGDLGEDWDVEAEISPVEGFAPILVNLRQPYASVMVWQPLRDPDPVFNLDAVQKVASTVFPDYERIELPDPASIITDQPYDTVVEVVTQAARADTDPEDWPLVSVLFERALGAVNDLVAALGDITSDPGLHTFSLEELDEFAVIGSRPVTEGFDVRPTLYPLNWRIRIPRTALSEDEKQRASIYLAVSWQGHPFMAYPRLGRAARRAREAGDYSQAAILASASGEILLNLLLRAMLVEEGAPDDLERLFGDDRGGFSARLRRDYGPRLGGTWDVDDPTNEVGHWVHGAQKLRNRVVHAGYSPTGGEASEALHGGEVLESFVFERLIDRRYKYPKTALSIFGEPGLRRRGLWNQRMRRVADELLVGLPEFWASVVGEPASPKADAR